MLSKESMKIHVPPKSARFEPSRDTYMGLPPKVLPSSLVYQPFISVKRSYSQSGIQSLPTNILTQSTVGEIVGDVSVGDFEGSVKLGAVVGEWLESGLMLGCVADGFVDGNMEVGCCDGCFEGIQDGSGLGVPVGCRAEGPTDGVCVGLIDVGNMLGIVDVGKPLGDNDGSVDDGLIDGMVKDGYRVGTSLVGSLLGKVTDGKLVG